MISVAQITDLHLFSMQNEVLHGVNPWQTYGQVMELLKKKPYDALFVTGDIADDGSMDAYANFILGVHSLNIPVYYVFGNHDDKNVFFQITKVIPSVRQNKCFVIGPWCFILLDSCAKGKDDGTLTSDEIDFLKNSIQNNADKHIVIFLHHHPLPINSAFMDACILTNGNELLNVVSEYDNVKIIAFGHIHQEFSTKISRVSFFGAPSTSMQFKPNQDLFTIDTTVAPGYREFVLHNDGSFSTNIYRIDKSHIE